MLRICGVAIEIRYKLLDICSEKSLCLWIHRSDGFASSLPNRRRRH
ncbi:hypothetical protein HSB1_04080 [Halogranum salarium B-1]|uniref:Uncharacterized protein n=1 Tax=Halogranum salarium B-1 TaxID=1210908 RepID=J3F048_9EURY|nr:hypothetical protein HSB1_04080 [Halogranum salarium B-1]